MPNAKDVRSRSTFRGSLVALAAMLASTGCLDATQPVAPARETTALPNEPASGAEHIYLARADGSVVVRLIPGSGPAWSPDGRRIAFHRNGEVHVVNADGSNDIRLSAGISPAWSPNGASLVFTSSEGISAMNADGSSVRTLIRHDFRDDTYKPWDMGVGKPTWSPDGARIAFEHLGDGDMQPAQIHVMGADGSGVRHLNTFPRGTRYAESDPSWSPDGSRLVYWSYGYGIAVKDTKGGGAPNAIYSDFPAVAYGAKPVWLPDGRSIAFNRGRHSPGAAVWIMSATGSGAKVLIPDGYDAAWSPNATQIAFVSTRS